MSAIEKMWLEEYLKIFKYRSKERPSDRFNRHIYSVSNCYYIVLGIVNFSENISSFEFLKDSSTKLMSIVSANRLSFDDITFQV